MKTTLVTALLALLLAGFPGQPASSRATAWPQAALGGASAQPARSDGATSERCTLEMNRFQAISLR